MNSTDLVAKVHEASYIDDSHPEYTSARIMGILWDQQNVNFSPLLVKSRQGFGLRWSVVPTVAGVPFVRIPSRAIVNSLERVDLSVDGVNYYKLREATPREWPAFETASGVPSAYMKRGDKLFLGAIPSSVLSVRLWYYLRPSQLHTAQTIGEVTAVVAATSVTVAAKPLKYPSVGGVGVAVGVGDLVDVVTSDGLYDAVATDALISSITGVGPYVLNFSGSPDLSQVVASSGHYVRAAQQTDWPALPVDVHGTLAELAAVVVLLGLGKREKASALAEKIGGDIKRFEDVINPRVKEDAYAARPTMTILRRGGRGRGGYF